MQESGLVVIPKFETSNINQNPVKMHVDLKKNTPLKKSMLKAGHVHINIDEIIQNSSPERSRTLPPSRGSKKDLSAVID